MADPSRGPQIHFRTTEPILNFFLLIALINAPVRRSLTRYLWSRSHFNRHRPPRDAQKIIHQMNKKISIPSPLPTPQKAQVDNVRIQILAEDHLCTRPTSVRLTIHHEMSPTLVYPSDIPIRTEVYFFPFFLNRINGVLYDTSLKLPSSKARPKQRQERFQLDKKSIQPLQSHTYFHLPIPIII